MGRGCLCLPPQEPYRPRSCETLSEFHGQKPAQSAKSREILQKFELAVVVQGHPKSWFLVPIKKRICNFLLVVNSNFGRISYRLRDWWRIKLENSFFSPLRPCFMTSSRKTPSRDPKCFTSHCHAKWCPTSTSHGSSYKSNCQVVSYLHVSVYDVHLMTVVNALENLLHAMTTQHTTSTSSNSSSATDIHTFCLHCERFSLRKTLTTIMQP